jgi:hypothetical protein
MNKTESPSRNYVAMCIGEYGGYFFKKFILPRKYGSNSSDASWYFANILQPTICLEGCVTFEDYSDFEVCEAKNTHETRV